MVRVQSQRGDTLVEVVFAIAIAGVVMASAYNVANLNYRVAAQARERTEATAIAQGQAELLYYLRDERAAGGSFLSIPGAAGSPHYATSGGINSGNLPSAGCSLVGCVAWIQKMSTSTPTRLYTQIHVTWTSAIGSTGNETVLDVILADQRSSTICDPDGPGGC